MLTTTETIYHETHFKQVKLYLGCSPLSGFYMRQSLCLSFRPTYIRLLLQAIPLLQLSEPCD